MNWNILILVLSSLGIAQALFLCSYLFTLKKGNRVTNIFLALVILGLTIRIGKSILNVYMLLEPWQRNLGIAGILLVGPSLWLYGKLLLGKSKNLLAKRTYLHFLPYVSFTMLCEWIPNRHDTLSYLIYNAVFAHLLVYLVLSVAHYLKYRPMVREPLQHWYRNLIIGVAFIWLFYMGHLSGLIPFYIGGALFFTLLMYMFSFLLLRRHTFSLEKYAGSEINPKTSKKLMDALNKLFTTKEIYLQPHLNLQEVASQLKTTPRKLSQVVNVNTGTNFSEFVNTYRIEKAKKLLLHPEKQQEKIASIAYDAGFGNVTSFNLSFKSVTQLTPSEFRKQHTKL